MGIYLQVITSVRTRKRRSPRGQIEYEIFEDRHLPIKLLDFSEDLDKLPNASASQVTIEKLLPLKNLAPGTYTLKIRAYDKNRNQSVEQQANFTVS